MLILQGRNHERLTELEKACASKGARVLVRAVDVRARDDYVAWLDDVCHSESIDLLIACAGVNTNIGEKGEGERWDEVCKLIEVNVLAAMATVDRVLPSMRARGGGQIALFSSLAAYFGLPLTPSYSASKAAIKSYGEALRGWLAVEGIQVSIVMPGYVESEMCRNMPGPKPFLWPADRAARCIRAGLMRNRPRISFPFPLNVGTWLLSVLPPTLSQKILRRFKYGG